MSASGRDRFSTWPDVIGDDYFVSGLFDETERTRVHEVEVGVELPARFRDCVSRRARVHEGNRAVEEAGLRRVGARGSQGRQLLALVRSQPNLVTDLPAHVVVTGASRLLAIWRRLNGTQHEFHRGRGDRLDPATRLTSGSPHE
jgi:hypothetical protein